jgi:hypothetical protein
MPPVFIVQRGFGLVIEELEAVFLQCKSIQPLLSSIFNYNAILRAIFEISLTDGLGDFIPRRDLQEKRLLCVIERQRLDVGQGSGHHFFPVARIRRILVREGNRSQSVSLYFSTQTDPAWPVAHALLSRLPPSDMMNEKPKRSKSRGYITIHS